MGLVSSKDCIWIAFTSPRPTKASCIVPSRISRPSSAPNAESISGYPSSTRKNNAWPFGCLQGRLRPRSASATKKTQRPVMVVHIDASMGISAYLPKKGSVSNVEMATPRALTYRVLLPSISTFETSPLCELEWVHIGEKWSDRGYCRRQPTTHQGHD